MSTTVEQGSAWKRRTAIALVFLVPLLLLFVLPELLPGEDTGDLVRFSLVTLGIGTVLFRSGFSQYRDRQLVRNTPTTKIRSLPVGNVEIKGEARPLENPLLSPLTHQKGCLFEFEIEEEHEGDDGSDWRTVFQLREEIDFAIDDGTGSVRLDANDADLEIEREERVHVDGGDLPPRAVREWARTWGYDDVAGDRGIVERLKDGLVTGGEPDEHLTGKSIHDRRYTETVLGVGEQTYVFGAARPRLGVESVENPENLVIDRHEGTGRFILSDVPEAELADDKIGSMLSKLGFAVVFLTAGVLATLHLFGVL